MDFFEHQDEARRKTFRLLLVYGVVVAAIVALAYFLSLAAVGTTQEGRRFLADRLWNPQLFIWTTGVTLTVIAIGNIYKLGQLADGGPAVAQMLGGHLLAPANCRAHERQLLKVVEEMAIASGVPVPPVYVLDDESGINAFAAGFRSGDAVIGVSRGAIEYLTRDELQGVLAHEFSHILNGDMRLNLRLIGLLHGILFISYLGDFLVRLACDRPRFWRNRSNREGRLGLHTLAVGVGLQMIGFLGVFFGSLIKSAVSKQREFLADASAVQFTRNPAGIAGALKKIGGLGQGSKLIASRAAQASHLFFSDGVGFSMVDLFATHPPLAERIRRVDPSWDGTFPDGILPVGVPQVTLSTAKIQLDSLDQPTKEAAVAVAPVQPLATAALLAGGWQGTPRAEPAALDVEEAAQQIGAPTAEHLAYAAALLAEIPADLRAALEEPFGAQAVVLLFLLGDEPAVRERQLHHLGEQLDEGQLRQFEGLLPVAGGVPVAARLPVLELSLPALRLLSEPQFRAFRSRVQVFVDADQRVSYFEYALLRSLDRHLAVQFDGPRRRQIHYHRLEPLLPACSVLLSILAHVGAADEKEAQRAFQASVLALSPEGGLRLHGRHDLSVRRIDVALDELARVTPRLKRSIVQACATCIGHDGRVTVEEGELLRAVADSLDCPLPPLLFPRKS